MENGLRRTMSTISEGAANVASSALSATTETLEDLESAHMVTMIIFGLCVFIVIVAFGWLWSKLTLESRNCQNMHKLYKATPPGFSSIDPDSPDNCNSLRDFYVKTAYNCCATGAYRNDFVSLCALEDCIRQGVRCLDFEIYSVNDSPVISVSAVNDFNVKGSYNSIPFADAMQTIERLAFGGNSNCPNPRDPLIIYLRIMSNNRAIYKEMADVLYSTLERRLLGKKYSYENHGLNLGKVPLKDLMEKVIIIADKTNALFEDTPLDEYVNTATRSPFMRILRYDQLKNVTSADELIDFNKKNMTMCLPNLGITPDNPSPSLAMSYGCQFTAMAYQNFDANLEHYDSMFDSAGAAFILKPANLRFIPVHQPNPPPQNEKLSYATRYINTPYQPQLPV